jgi:hypothetical protein
MDDPSGFTAVTVGRGVGVVGTTITALLDAPADHPVVVSLWEAALDGAEFDDCLSSLGRRGFAALPDLAVVSFEGPQCRVVVRGDVLVDVESVDGECTAIRGSAIRTWAEHAVPSSGRATLALASDPNPISTGPFLVNLGLVPASALVVHAQDSATATDSVGPLPRTREPDADPFRATPAPTREETILPDDLLESMVPAEANAPVAATEPPAVEEPVDDLSVAPDDPVAPDAPENAGEPLFGSSAADDVDDVRSLVAGADAVGPVAQTDGPPADVVGPPVAAEVEPAPVDEPPAEVLAPAAELHADEPETNSYDHLFGETQLRSVEDAAVRADLADDAPNEQPVLEGDADHDGRTVSFGDVRALLEREEAGRPRPPEAGDSLGDGNVHAVRCPAGHLNPARQSLCRVCDASIPSQPSMVVKSPALGVFEFATGMRVPVQGPMLIGRSPAVSGPVAGVTPALVTVDSPSQDVSRTHLEVRVEDWDVWLVDRDSTNGTVVTPPRRQPQRLRPGQPFPLALGSTVDMADEVVFRYTAD